MRRSLISLLCLAVVANVAISADPEPQTLEVVAQLPQRPTGIAVAADGRVFVSLPFAEYADPAKFVGSLVRLDTDGIPRPYPDAAWNENPATASGDPARRFLNVQGHTIDAAGQLWALDRGRPMGGPVVPGGAKLVGIDLATARVTQVITLPPSLAEGNFLNDVRVDARSGTAYITDTANGGIVVVDIAAATARWALRAGAWVRPEPRQPVVQGVVITDARRAKTPHTADGLALSPDGRWLYLQAHPWIAPELYRVSTTALRDAALSPDEVAAKVEHVGRTVFSDGIEVDLSGRVYFTDYEGEAITRREPNGSLVQVAHDPRLSWPDAIAFAPDGAMYATVAQFHRLAAANNGIDRTEPPFLIVRVPNVAPPAGGVSR